MVSQVREKITKYEYIKRLFDFGILELTREGKILRKIKLHRNGFIRKIRNDISYHKKTGYKEVSIRMHGKTKHFKAHRNTGKISTWRVGSFRIQIPDTLFPAFYPLPKIYLVPRSLFRHQTPKRISCCQKPPLPALWETRHRGYGCFRW